MGEGSGSLLDQVIAYFSSPGPMLVLPATVLALALMVIFRKLGPLPHAPSRLRTVFRVLLVVFWLYCNAAAMVQIVRTASEGAYPVAVVLGAVVVVSACLAGVFLFQAVSAELRRRALLRLADRDL